MKQYFLENPIILSGENSMQMSLRDTLFCLFQVLPPIWLSLKFFSGDNVFSDINFLADRVKCRFSREIIWRHHSWKTKLRSKSLRESDHKWENRINGRTLPVRISFIKNAKIFLGMRICTMNVLPSAGSSTFSVWESAILLFARANVSMTILVSFFMISASDILSSVYCFLSVRVKLPVRLRKLWKSNLRRWMWWYSK